MRKGRFSIEEQQFLHDNHDHLSIGEMAKALDRDVVSVTNYVQNKIGKTISGEKIKSLTAQYDIQNSVLWTDLKEQFSKQELALFLFHWGRIVSQFREDIFPTEEMQIIDLVKLEILMDRVLKQKHKNTESISNLDNDLMEEKNKDADDQDQAIIIEIEKNLCFARAAQTELSREFRELMNKKKDILRELKATREQRIKRLEDSKQTFVGWMQSIISDRELRAELGINMEKMRLASEKERARISEYHVYENGEIDQPFLTPETVKDE